jgi:hypothetical protein
MTDIIQPRRNSLVRLPNWHGNLVAHVQRLRSKPFEIGENDCATFWIGAVEAMTGVRTVDVTWRNTADCLARLRANGDSLEKAFGIIEALGPATPLDGSVQLQRGDIVIHHQPSEGDTFSVVWDPKVMVGPGVNHLEMESTANVRAFWRV